MTLSLHRHIAKAGDVHVAGLFSYADREMPPPSHGVASAMRTHDVAYDGRGYPAERYVVWRSVARMVRET